VLTQADLDAMQVNQTFLLKEKMMKQAVDVNSLVFR
jgi:hypothetical protein